MRSSSPCRRCLVIRNDLSILYHFHLVSDSLHFRLISLDRLVSCSLLSLFPTNESYPPGSPAPCVKDTPLVGLQQDQRAIQFGGRRPITHDSTSRAREYAAKLVTAAIEK